MNKLIILFLFIFFILPVFGTNQKDFICDTLIEENIKAPEINPIQDYSDTTIVAIKLQVVDEIKSEKDLYEGQIIKFKIFEDVRYKNKILVKKGDIATSKVETIITNGMNGIPASIIFGSFNISNLESNKITFTYEKFGKDLSLLVFPLKWSLTLLPPSGSLTNFIKGGHAKLSTKKIITLYYHPEWK